MSVDDQRRVEADDAEELKPDHNNTSSQKSKYCRSEADAKISKIQRYRIKLRSIRVIKRNEK